MAGFDSHTRAPDATFDGSFLSTIWQITEAGTPARPLRPDEQVGNVEGLCRGVLKELCYGLPEPLEDADWAESLGFLLGEVVVLTGRYPSGREGFVFRAWLYQRLCWRLVDHWRRTFGRHGEKRVPDSRLAGQDGLDLGDRPADRLEPVAGGDVADSADALRWLLADGDREAAGPVGRLRRGEAARAAAGDGRAGARPGGRALGGVARAPRGAPAWRDCVSCGWRHYAAAPNGVDAWHYPDFCEGCGIILEAAA